MWAFRTEKLGKLFKVFFFRFRITLNRIYDTFQVMQYKVLEKAYNISKMNGNKNTNRTLNFLFDDWVIQETNYDKAAYLTYPSTRAIRSGVSTR